MLKIRNCITCSVFALLGKDNYLPDKALICLIMIRITMKITILMHTGMSSDEKCLNFAINHNTVFFSRIRF